ncbi:MAG: WD40/YVTN/BNR-like repeat-containing protein, partial [Nitrospiria bacterium]
LGKGGWNVVSLKEYAGYLYVGLEGNGKIFRSHDGNRWQEVADTDRHTVYGITVFQGALYAGTNDPDPEIWKSTDGVNWALEARLPPEDHGVISLSVFKDDLYAGTARAWIYRSRDGRRWEKVADLQQVTTAAYVRWVRFLLPFQEHLYAGLEKGPVYRTSNGRDWEPIPQSITEQVGARGAVVFQSAFYMGTTGAGTIWRTTDGVRWKQVFTAPTHVRRGYVAAMAVAADHLYASVDGYLFRTRDGERWEEIGHLGPYTLEALAAWGQSLYVGTLIPPQALLYRAALQP